MSLTKKYALALSMIMIAPVQQSQAFVTPDLKGAAKASAFLAVGTTLAYYFFHYPVDRRSDAPIENIFCGRWDNVTHDLFSWDNVTNCTEIIPGQRWKVYPYTISVKESDEKEIKIPVTNKSDIRGFGLYHFCEKNMKKIVKYFAATGALYGLLYGDLKTTGKDILETIFDAYKNVPGKV